MGPIFSIVIPTLNEANFLPRLLEDLANQKEKDFDVIIVDSFSTDDIENKIRKLEKTLKIKFFKVKSNVSRGRNYGASKARGDYLIFLDADAQIGSSFTELLKKSIKKTRGLIYIPSIMPDRGNFQLKMAFKLINSLVEFSQNLAKPFSTGGSMIVERHFFLRMGGFDEKLFVAEDHSLIQTAQKWGVKARFLRNLKLKFSLRRMRREGAFILFYKYLVSTAHVLFKGNIYEEIYAYPMGGSLYGKRVTSKNEVNKYLQLLLKEFNPRKKTKGHPE